LKMPHPAKIREKKKKKRTIEMYRIKNIGFIYNFDINAFKMNKRVPIQNSNIYNGMVTIYCKVMWTIPSGIPAIQSKWFLLITSISVRFFQARSPWDRTTASSAWKPNNRPPMNHETSPAIVNFVIYYTFRPKNFVKILRRWMDLEPFHSDYKRIA